LLEIERKTSNFSQILLLGNTIKPLRGNAVKTLISLKTVSLKPKVWNEKTIHECVMIFDLPQGSECYVIRFVGVPVGKKVFTKFLKNEKQHLNAFDGKMTMSTTSTTTISIVFFLDKKQFTFF